MRKTVNATRVCSSENYESSKHAHMNMLKENHEKVKNMVFSACKKKVK